MNALPFAGKTVNHESGAAMAAIQESTVAALETETPTNPASIQSEKNRVLTGPVGPNGAHAQLPAATVSDESREPASARIFSTTMLTALACRIKKNPAQSARALALIETGDLGLPVLPHAAMRFELVIEATVATLQKNSMLNPAIC